MDDHEVEPIFEAAGEEERGFFSMFISRLIEQSPDDPVSARLAGFPANLLYAALRKSNNGVRLESCCYWHRPDTYAEDAGHREMIYAPKVESPYWVRIEYDFEKRCWRIFKHRNEMLVAVSEGPELAGTATHATLIGLQPDEPVDES